MAVVTWNPTRQANRMQADLERLFGLPFGQTAGWNQTASYAPAVDVYETEHALVVTAVVPGVREDNLEISVTGDQFTLRGKLEPETWAENEKRVYYLNERRHGTFARTFTLPFLVASDAAEARLDNGVLTISLPKAEESKPKAIRINRASAKAEIAAEGATEGKKAK